MRSERSLKCKRIYLQGCFQILCLEVVELNVGGENNNYLFISPICHLINSIRSAPTSSHVVIVKTRNPLYIVNHLLQGTHNTRINALIPMIESNQEQRSTYYSVRKCRTMMSLPRVSAHSLTHKLKWSQRSFLIHLSSLLFITLPPLHLN